MQFPIPRHPGSQLVPGHIGESLGKLVNECGSEYDHIARLGHNLLDPEAGATFNCAINDRESTESLPAMCPTAIRTHMWVSNHIIAVIRSQYGPTKDWVRGGKTVKVMCSTIYMSPCPKEKCCF